MMASLNESSQNDHRSHRTRLVWTLWACIMIVGILTLGGLFYHILVTNIDSTCKAGNYQKTLQLAKIRELIPWPMPANLLMDEGAAFYSMQRYPQAIRAYSRAIKTHPLSDAYYLRARAYMDQQNYTAALDDLNHALSLEKKASYYQERADCRFIIEKANIQKGPDSIIARQITEDYQKGIELAPLSLDLHAHLMNFLLVSSHDVTEAVHEAKIVRQLYDSSYRHLGRFKIASADQSMDFALSLLAEACAHRNQLDSALVYLDEIDHVQPNDTLSTNLRGIFLMKKKDYKAAITQYQKAIPLNQEPSERGYTYLALAKSQQLTGHLRGAKNSYQQGMQLLSNQPDLTLLSNEYGISAQEWARMKRQLGEGTH